MTQMTVKELLDALKGMDTKKVVYIDELGDDTVDEFSPTLWTVREYENGIALVVNQEENHPQHYLALAEKEDAEDIDDDWDEDELDEVDNIDNTDHIE